MQDKVAPQLLNSFAGPNFASALKSILLNSRHEWQYCFLDRGGDATERYFSAAQLLNSAEQIARRLVAITPPQSAVILAMEHGADFLICLLAAIFAQRTVIPAPLPRFVAHIQRFCAIAQLCDQAFILTTQHNADPIKKALQQAHLTATGRLLSLETITSGLNGEDNGADNEDYQVELPGFATDPKTPIVIQFTSGSTSSPKGVLISSENILANQHEVSSRWHFHPDKIVLNWLPYYHDMGLFGGLLYPLLGGLRVVQMDPLHFIQKPQRWLFAMSKFKVNISGGPAFSYSLCTELDLTTQPKKIDLSHWQIAFCGADYVPADSIKQFCSLYSAYGFQSSAMMPVYGLAEATLFVAGQPNIKVNHPPEYTENKTMGCYLGGAQQPNIYIRHVKSGDVLSPGDIGEICFSGASVTQGYYQQQMNHQQQMNLQPEMNLSHGMLKSGDLGFIKDDYLFICGRLKDIIISHGQNISAAAIEQTAASLSTELNPHATAVFQLSPPGNEIVLLMEVNKSLKGRIKNKHNLRSDIIALVMQRLGVRLSDVVFLKRGELMKTSSGKVQRQLVAEHFRLGHLFKEADHDNS